MYHFEKAYTRDNMLVIQEAWEHVLGEGFARALGIPVPDSFATLYFVTDGVVEIWDNLEHFEWLKDALLSKNHSDSAFLQGIFDNHQETLQELAEIMKGEEIVTKEQLHTLIDLLYKGSQEFVLLYYSAMDERTPEPQKTLATQFRTADKFYDDCDHSIRKAMRTVFPQYAGYEIAVFRSELGDEPASPELLKRRATEFVYVPGRISEYMSLEEYAKGHPEYHFDFDHTEEGEAEVGLKGMPAFRGVARGKVQIMKRKEQIPDFIEGNILIAPMTTPHFLSAMHKAAAFVTDEGGITCHAAIIAREMKKPCVIGTRRATKVFKDGDTVEVDAVHGIVRKVD